MRQRTEAMRLGLEVQVSICLGHDTGALQTKVEGSQGNDGAAVGRRVVCLCYDARFLVDVAEDGLVVDERLLACPFEHFAHVLCVGVRFRPVKTWIQRNLPQP
jgi:hypothetical protein